MTETGTGSLRVGINGFGRIGRLLLRAIVDESDLVPVHVNDPAADAATAAHLVRHDSIFGRWSGSIEADGEGLSVGRDPDTRRSVSLSRSRDPAQVPWPDVDLVFECTGLFRTAEALEGHRRAGAPRVLCSQPTKDPDHVPDLVYGVNHEAFDGTGPFATAASCTTNCIAPPMDVVHRTFGIRHGALNTIHAFTSSQKVLDDYSGDLRRARAAGESLIPTTTGSATAIGRIFPELAGHVDGIAIRVPMPGPSLSDLVLELDERTTTEAVNEALHTAAEGRLQGILGYSQEPLVSVDYRGDPRSGVVDGLTTRVQGGTQLRLLVWYDNEWGYVHRLLDVAVYWGRKLRGG